MAPERGRPAAAQTFATPDEAPGPTMAYSKKIENHAHMCALYTVWYNFARINSAVKMSPAMAAGLSKTLWDVADIVKLVEAHELKEAA